MLYHGYDNSCLFLTPPVVYEATDDEMVHASQDVVVLINVIVEKVSEFSKIQHPAADYRNRHPWGKIMLRVKRIIDFPF